MPLNASISPSTTPRTAPCRVHATSGSLALQPGTCAEAVEAVTANRERATSLVNCAIVGSFCVPLDQQYRGTLESPVLWRKRHKFLTRSPHVAATTETTTRSPTRDPNARPAIQTLERLHAERGGKILENKQLHADLAEQMRHVEAVIKMLDPGYSLRAISVKRRKPNPWFKRGTMYRRAVDMLRVATEPLTARDIAE